MQRNDFYLLGMLLLIVILIFYPVFYTDYIFSDEALQLWKYRPGSGFNMFISQGRWLTEILFGGFFSAIDTIHELTYLRLFSFFGWLVCIPLWYLSLKRVMGNEPGYQFLPFFVCLYLVCSLPFAVSVQWASTMQLFIANTSGLLSGVVLYKGIRFSDDKFKASVPAVIASIVLAMVSFFTYQSGIGCFLIPFLFHYISAYTSKKDRVLIAGLVFYFLLYALYFPLYKLSVQLNHIPHNPRTSLHIDVIDKLAFFLARPLERSFRFTIIADEDSKLAGVVYKLLLAGWMLLAFVRFGKTQWLQAVKYIAAVLVLWLLSYLPSMIVTENFASNRTMQALDCLVFLVFAEMALTLLKKKQARSLLAAVTVVVFIFSARYNFRRLFLQPVHEEYVAVKNYYQQHYNRKIHTIYFIRPAENAFVQKFHISSSVDEFGVPSTFMDQVPVDLSRQLVFELTGNRAVAEALNIQQWPDRTSFENSGAVTDSNTMVIDMPAIINTIPQ